MQSHTAITERDSIDHSERYRFNPANDGHCQMSQKGQVILRRRLVRLVLGINFPRTNLTVVKKIDKNSHFRSLILAIAKEPNDDQITVYRHKHGALLVLSSLFKKLNLDYKRFQFTFVCEPVTLDDKTIGIRVTVQDIIPRPEFTSTMSQYKVVKETAVDKRATSSVDHLVGMSPLIERVNDRPTIEEDQFRAVFTTFLDWKASQKNQTDRSKFKRSFADFTKNLNQILFCLAQPDIDP